MVFQVRNGKWLAFLFAF
ncbi:hypothetical protein LJR084_000544 [Variovorax sp. LjRoot84]